MYLSYSGHSACVCLLFKTFSVQGKPFLTGCIILFWSFWSTFLNIFHSRQTVSFSVSFDFGFLRRISIYFFVWLSFSSRMNANKNCMDFQKEKDAFFLSTFPNIFHSRQTVTFSVPKHFPFKENHFLFCWF